jgi:hypothetical protein
MRYVVHNHFPARTVDAHRGFADVWAQACSIDPLQYLKGLSKLSHVNDIDNHWNGSYSPDNDEIELSKKFHDKPFMQKVQILVHEAGHRGQKFDPKTFERMKSDGLIKLPYFLAMANKEHQEDYKKNGIERKAMADEIFAESYSRFAFGMDMPDALRKFWERRMQQ